MHTDRIKSKALRFDDRHFSGGSYEQIRRQNHRHHRGNSGYRNVIGWREILRDFDYVVARRGRRQHGRNLRARDVGEPMTTSAAVECKRQKARLVPTSAGRRDSMLRRQFATDRQPSVRHDDPLGAPGRKARLGRDQYERCAEYIDPTRSARRLRSRAY
jgi:hypothetical protein